MHTHDTSLNHPMTDTERCRLSITECGAESYSILGPRDVLS